MAERSKALQLTARCLSPLHGFESLPGHIRKLPVTKRNLKKNPNCCMSTLCNIIDSKRLQSVKNTRR